MTIFAYTFVRSLISTGGGPEQFEMYHCDHLPIPTDPAHYCEVCLTTPGKASLANSHFTKDCPLLHHGQLSFISKTYHNILKDRQVIPQERNIRTKQLDIDIIEAYYRLSPITQKPRPTEEYPTPYNPDHYCTVCKPGSNHMNLFLAHTPPDGDQSPHFVLDCERLNAGEVTERFSVFDRALRHIGRCPADCSGVSKALVDMVGTYYGLQSPNDTPITTPQERTPSTKSDHMSTCTTEPDQNTDVERLGLGDLDYQSSYTIEPNHTNETFGSDHLELSFASMRQDVDTPIDTLQRASEATILHDVTPDISDPEPTPQPSTTPQDIHESYSMEQTSPTNHGKTLPTDIVALTIRPSTDPRPQKPGNPSPMTGTNKNERRPSPGNISYDAQDDPPAIDGGFQENADCLSQVCQQSSFIFDKALNISWATGVSEYGPHSNVERTEDYCNHHDRVSNLGQSHQYGIALSDPYIKIVPPPPITVQLPD